MDWRGGVWLNDYYWTGTVPDLSNYLTAMVVWFSQTLVSALPRHHPPNHGADKQLRRGRCNDYIHVYV